MKETHEAGMTAKEFLHWFGVFGMRFATCATILGEIEAVLTHQIAYDSWIGAFAILNAAACWTVADHMVASWRTDRCTKQ